MLNTMINVLLVARSVAARSGLRAIIGSSSRVRVIGEAAELSSVSPLDLERADILVLDEPGSSLELALDTSTEHAPALLLIGRKAGAPRALDAWPTSLGVLEADASADQIRVAVEALGLGLSVRSGPLVNRYVSSSEPDVTAELTPREREVLQLVAGGLANKGIAQRLGISEHTVKFHLASVLTKLGAASRAEAVAIAARRGWIAL